MLLTAAGLLPVLIAAIPEPSPYPNPQAVAPRQPVITPSVVEYYPTRTNKHKRNIFSDIESGKHDSNNSNGCISTLTNAFVA